jgi:hypothetical protein
MHYNKMSLFTRHKYRDRCCVRCILSCCAIGYILILLILIIKHSQSSICLPATADFVIVDRQDEWKYQNSITGQWYNWKLPLRKQHNDTEWTVKWLNTSPKSSLGVIVYLTTRNELASLNQSFLQLSRLLFLSPRPVVIFHEGDFNDNDLQQSLAHTLGVHTPLAFERIEFSKRSNQDKSIRHRIPFTYLNMCRFFTLMLPNHPLLTLFSYYWRLDAHSFIFGPNHIRDPFEIMQKQQIQYAFIMANEEDEIFAVGLWSFFYKFLNTHCLKPSVAVSRTQTGWFGGYSYAIIFTNFAIANVSLFRDHPLMQSWLQAVDLNDGIYRHRWGDAPVHTLVLSQLIERNQIVRFRYFGYMHRHEYVCASGIEGSSCEKQVQSFFTKDRSFYDNYDDGCWPSSRNPLCHYYPRIEL